MLRATRWLATDGLGLHGALTDAQLQALWQPAPSPQEGLQALHRTWRQARAQDDVSVILPKTGG